MLELSKAAKEQLDQHFAGKEVPSLRISLTVGCGGPRLVLSVDEQKDSDSVLHVEGYTFVMENSLLQEAAPIRVEFNHYYGFKLQSRLTTSSSGCGSCTACG